VELDVPEHRGRATAAVSWKKQRQQGIDVGLHFQAASETHRRSMRRLVLEILRRMPEPS